MFWIKKSVPGGSMTWPQGIGKRSVWRRDARTGIWGRESRGPMGAAEVRRGLSLGGPAWAWLIVDPFSRLDGCGRLEAGYFVPRDLDEMTAIVRCIRRPDRRGGVDGVMMLDLRDLRGVWTGARELRRFEGLCLSCARGRGPALFSVSIVRPGC